MARKILYLFFLLIIFSPVLVRAKTQVDIDATTPSKIFCEYPFVASFHLESISPQDNFKARAWAVDSYDKYISSQNWDNESSWKTATRYYANFEGLTGTLLIKIIDCKKNVAGIKIGINICAKENSCASYISKTFNLTLVTDQQRSISISNLTDDISSLYFSDTGNEIIEPFCPPENCTTDKILLPQNKDSLNIYSLEDNSLKGAISINEIEAIFQPQEYQCLNTANKISAYTYTRYFPELPDCIDANKIWWINKNNTQYNNGFIIPSEQLSEILQIILFPHNHIKIEALDINPIIFPSKLVSELYPTGEEWIEFFNPTQNDIELCNFIIDDGPAGSSPFEITQDCIIKSQEYKIIHLPRHIFNDTGDSFFLTDPFGKIIEQFNYQKIKIDQSLIFYENLWQITDNPTKGEQNIYYQKPTAKKIENIEVDADNQIYEIKIYQASEYLDKLVKITGYIVNPSGNTWWLEDETGKIKIYLQPKRNIKHERYYSGLRMTVIGRVNLYRGILRILPEKAEHLILLEHKVKAQTSTNNTTTKKNNSPPKKITIKATNASFAQNTEQFDPLATPVKLTKTNNSNLSLKFDILIVIISCICLTFIFYENITKYRIVKK